MRFRSHFSRSVLLGVAVAGLLVLLGCGRPKIETSLDLSVPVAEDGQEPMRTAGEIIVDMQDDGSFGIDTVALSKNELLDKLQRVAATHQDQAVLLRGGSETDYAHIISVLDICQKAGIWNVAFATSRPVPPTAVQ